MTIVDKLLLFCYNLNIYKTFFFINDTKKLKLFRNTQVEKKKKKMFILK